MLAVSLIIIMITCIFSVYIMYPGAAQPPVTNVSGVISSIQHELANSPYNFTGDITIGNGVTLTIQPGVDVLENGNAMI